MRNAHTTALTPNSILNKCKRLLGVKTFVLPFTDAELLDILYEDTLPTFSRFFPRYAKLKMDLSKMRIADYSTLDRKRSISSGSRAYHIDISSYGSDLAIVDIEDIKNLNTQVSNFGTPNAIVSNGYDMLLGAFAQASLESMICVPPIYFYEAPDKLVIEELGNLSETDVVITFLLVHAYDLSTIKITYMDKLKEMYMLDLKISLYEVLKHSDKIDTTFGQIDLKIDDWQSAYDQRKELENTWENEFLAHRRKTIYRV